MIHRLKQFLFVIAVCSTAVRADEPQPDSPLDELLSTPISTAAKYEQNMSDVAASVTIISAEEIARYGWRSLAEVLTAVRGVYTTSDHGYTYLGVRGIGLPTDYNNRFLILLDGHPLYESVSGSIDVGTGLAIDMATVDRIELVRGPGSIMYGTGAMFGVINLITKDERERAAAEIATGSGDLRTGSARGGFVLGELRASAALCWREDGGREHYYREFDTPQTGNGISDRDHDDYTSLIVTTRWRDLRLVTLRSTRNKGVPTASWGTTFGADEHITDGRTLWALSGFRNLGIGKRLTARAFYDRFHYAGNYPHGSFALTDASNSRRLGGELRYIWDLRPNHRLTTGAEYVSNRARYSWNDSSGAFRSAGDPFAELSGHVQIESQLTKRISATAGLRYDRRTGVEPQITPRGALILRPATGSVLKVLYGQAFRAPSVYELDYDSEDFLPSNAGAESIRTTEVVLEQRVTESILATVSLFDVNVDDLIRLQPVGNMLQFQNVSAAQSRGAEFQVDYRRSDGLWGYVSYTNQRTSEDGAEMRNSPARMIKAGISTATANRAYGAIETQHESGRRTNSGVSTDDATLVNVNFGLRIGKTATIALAMRNAFDAFYATPGGLEHRQNSIEQDGRTYILGLKVGGR